MTQHLHHIMNSIDQLNQSITDGIQQGEMDAVMALISKRGQLIENFISYLPLVTDKKFLLDYLHGLREETQRMVAVAAANQKLIVDTLVNIKNLKQYL